MKTKDSVINTFLSDHNLLERLSFGHKIQAIILGGSRMLGHQTSHSDYDIELVFADEDMPDIIAKLSKIAEPGKPINKILIEDHTLHFFYKSPNSPAVVHDYGYYYWRIELALFFTEDIILYINPNFVKQYNNIVEQYKSKLNKNIELLCDFYVDILEKLYINKLEARQIICKDLIHLYIISQCIYNQPINTILVWQYKDWVDTLTHFDLLNEDLTIPAELKTELLLPIIRLATDYRNNSIPKINNK